MSSSSESEPAIRIEHLAKRFLIGQNQQSGHGLRHAIEDTLRMPLDWLRGDLQLALGRQQEFWALDDVSLEVPRGQVLGIVGKNGAGKSTLLKILCRITEPTKGRIEMRGRVASLLEVGTGFHPELTGRENIYLNGTILGMRRSEIQRKFDQIVAFSEIEKFIDTPVKRYSSGMYVRLAFAVAAHLEPEILIVDEVLAVGDADFQKKCLGKMHDVATGEGRTILFVSHNMAAVNSLCDRAILLSKGQLVADSSPADITSRYLRESIDGADEAPTPEKHFEPDPSKAIQILSIRLKDTRHEYRDPIDVELEFALRHREGKPHATLVVRDEQGHVIYTTTDDDLSPTPLTSIEPGTYCYHLRLPEKLLKPGTYFLTCSISDIHNKKPYDRKDNILTLQIEDHYTRRSQIPNGYRQQAIIAPEIPWSLTPHA